MVTKLTALATATGGTYLTSRRTLRIHALQLQADAKPGCVYAKNLVAEATRTWSTHTGRATRPAAVKFIVLAGNDYVLPFFRYPDTSSIGTEVNYFPPVNGTSASEASLRSNYVLGQDAYGASTTLSLGAVLFPIPDLPVGRLVETPTEIAGMAQAYLDQIGRRTRLPHSSPATTSSPTRRPRQDELRCGHGAARAVADQSPRRHPADRRLDRDPAQGAAAGQRNDISSLAVTSAPTTRSPRTSRP